MAVLRGFTLLLALQLIGEVLVRLSGVSVPGPVVGLLLFIAALSRLSSLERPAADALLAHLSLLFMPAGVGVIVHLGRLDGALLGVAATLLGSTVIGLAVTALVLQALLRRAGAIPVERSAGCERTAEGERRG